MANEFTNAVGAAVIQDDKVFMTKVEGGDQLVFPYGTYDAEEGIIDSLKEVMKDKYGVEVDVKDFIHSSGQADEGDELVLSVYACDVTDGQLPEGDEFEWVPVSELREANLAPVCELIAVRIVNELS